MNDAARKQYFKDLDTNFGLQDALEEARKRIARREVEKGEFEEEDSWSMEEWERSARDATARSLEGLVGRERVTAAKGMKQDTKRSRRRTMERREVRREMEMEKETRLKSEGSDGGS